MSKEQRKKLIKHTNFTLDILNGVLYELGSLGGSFARGLAGAKPPKRRGRALRAPGAPRARRAYVPRYSMDYDEAYAMLRYRLRQHMSDDRAEALAAHLTDYYA